LALAAALSCAAIPAAAWGEARTAPGTDLYQEAPGPFAGQDDIDELVGTSFTGMHQSTSAAGITLSGQLVDQYEAPVPYAALGAAYGTASQSLSTGPEGTFSVTFPAPQPTAFIIVSYAGDEEMASSSTQQPSIPAPSLPYIPLPLQPVAFELPSMIPIPSLTLPSIPSLTLPSPPTLPVISYAPPTLPPLGTITLLRGVVLGQLYERVATPVRVSTDHGARWVPVTRLKTSEAGSFRWRLPAHARGELRFSALGRSLILRLR
jgi:hypothetical protein